MKRKCYFINEGVLFDKNDKTELKDCWNCNGNCCKADLCNGLWCTEYGIEFNKKAAEEFIKYSVKNGCENSYGYLKEVEIDLPKELWNDIENDLSSNYHFTKHDIKKKGFIPFDFYEVIEDYSSYWEQPDISYVKKNGKVLKNILEIKKEYELDPNIVSWVNQELYGEVKKENKKEVESYGI